MLGLLAALAAVEALDLDRSVLVARLVPLLWFAVAVLVVLSLRLLEVRTGRTATQVGEVREVRDTVRRVAGSVGRLSRAQDERGQATAAAPARPPAAAPTPARAPAPPATRAQPAPARKPAPATDESDLHLRYGRHTAPALGSEQEWQAIAQWLPHGPATVPAGVVAALAPPDTLRRLREVATVRPLMPGYCLGTLERTPPRLVVVDRTGLAQGAWTGTELPVGFDLFGEVCEVAAWAKQRSVPLYWLDSPAPDAPLTAALRGLASVALPQDEGLLAPWGAPGSEVVALLHSLAAARDLPRVATGASAP
jgi:hypothetical protein